MDYAQDLINEPREKCIFCKGRYPKDEITADNICLNCLDEKDYLADMQRKRILEDW